MRGWPTFRTLFYYRCADGDLDKASKVLFKACRVALPPLTSVELGAKSIGGGLRITHHCCVVYAERIGENVGIGPFVVVGAHDNAFPTIADGVRISANSVVMGGITLGSDGDALIGLWFDGQKYYADTLDRNSHEMKLPIFEETVRWLDIYFSGHAPDFTPQFRLRTTAFRRLIAGIMLTISFGGTMT